MKTPVHIRHTVGRCPGCGAPILDAGWTDTTGGWTHAWPWTNESENPHTIAYGLCSMTLGLKPWRFLK